MIFRRELIKALYISCDGYLLLRTSMDLKLFDVSTRQSRDVNLLILTASNMQCKTSAILLYYYHLRPFQWSDIRR